MFSKIPFNDIVKIGQRTMLNEGVFNVSWILGRFCNYSCSYCWPYAHTDKPDHLNIEVYKNTIDEIKSQARANGFNRFHFSFSGGEPTAYKQFGEVIEHYADDSEAEYQSLHMTTNLSPGSIWWNRWLEATANMDRRSITASYHAEFAHEQEFGDKCLQLMKGGVYVTINQVMVPEMFDELYERLERFAARGINVTLKPQSNNTATAVVGGYTDDQIKILQEGFPQTIPQEYQEVVPLLQVELEDFEGNKYYIDQAERLNALDFNQFKGWNCRAGYQSCVIRGTEVKRAYSCKEEPLGTLYDGFTLFKAPSKCVTERCVSSADNKIPKHLNTSQ